MKTLVLCSANVCRSPVAEALWRDGVAARGMGFAVGSAGLRAKAGQAPSTTMVRLLRARGVTVPETGAVPFHRTLARQYGLILVMEPSQQQHVLSLAPELTGRVHLLGRWGQGTIADPMGREPAAYEHCVEQISTAVEAWMDRLAPVTHSGARPLLAKQASLVHAHA